VIAQELLRNPDVLVGKRSRIGDRGLFVPARFLKVRALKRAVNADLSLRAAADRADVAVDAGTIPSWLSCVTDFTQNPFDSLIVSSGHEAD
jgi:hypothetical protein